MYKIIFEGNEELVVEAGKILDDEGLTLEVAIRVLLKRIIKEKSMAFLLKNNLQNNNTAESFSGVCEQEVIGSANKVERSSVAMLDTSNEKKMTKSIAIRLLRDKGFNVGKSVTYASKNRGAYNYWANPEFGMLSADWDIILHDWISKKIYLFTVPANTLHKNQLIPRSDKTYLIDLQIMYHDTTFTDNRSGVSFAKYLVGEVQY